jgi:isocitrate dehydrogenase
MANPSGLLLSAVMMLVHIGQPEIATLIHNAWLTALKDGIHTPDLQGENTLHAVGTQAFADAVIARLGSLPQRLKVADYASQGTAPALEMPSYVRQTPL